MDEKTVEMLMMADLLQDILLPEKQRHFHYEIGILIIIIITIM